MSLLYTVIMGTALSIVFNSPVMGLVVAAIIIAWLALLAWQSRNDPIDPTLY